MPIYDYKCLTCGNIQEVDHPVGLKPDKIFCEKCGKEKLRRIFGNISFIRKNSDFENSLSDESKIESSGSPCSSCAGGNCSTCSV